MNLTSARIQIIGTDTLAGAALAAAAQSRGGLISLLSADDTHGWRDAAAIEQAIALFQPDYLFVVAGESGGIALNQAYPARLMESNLCVVLNVLGKAARLRVPRLIYLASSCCYSRDAVQPLRIENLMTGRLESTNTAYATAKLAGIQFCEAVRQEHGLAWFATIPSTLYGPEDHFDPAQAHVATSLMIRMHQAKQQHLPVFSVWGTGTPRRDFLFSSDFADAAFFLAEHYDAANGPINVGPDSDYSIAEVARMVQQVVGYEGRLEFDSTKPDGTPIKRLDATALRSLGWQPKTDFVDGLRKTYAAFLKRNLVPSDSPTPKATAS